MSKFPKDEDLVEIIVKTIEDEPFFTKEVLIPKIVSVIKVFRVNLKTANYQKEGSPSDFGRMLISNEKKDFENKFWKSKLKDIIGDEKMNEYFELLDREYSQINQLQKVVGKTK